MTSITFDDLDDIAHGVADLIEKYLPDDVVVDEVGRENINDFLEGGIFPALNIQIGIKDEDNDHLVGV